MFKKLFQVSPVLFMASAVLAGISDLPSTQSVVLKSEISLDRQKEDSPVTIKNGHFWRDGKRFKIWGTNFCSSVKQDYPDLPLSFDRMADVGFNVIRLNLFDGNLVDTSQPNSFTLPRSKRGDGSQIDLLDYCIFLAKKHGMVFWQMFDRSRQGFVAGDYDVLPDDGTRAEWERLIKETGPSCLVYLDDRAERAFEKFAWNLLEHVNPYTGYRYADDPSIGVWEIFNENGFVEALINTGMKNSPETAKRVNRRWNEWLARRYRTTNRLEKVWGSLNPGESMEKKNIEYAPVLEGTQTYKTAGYQTEFQAKDPAGVKKYPYARGEDVVRFACDMYIGHTNRFKAFVRSLGKPGRGISVVPICPSGRFGQNLPSYYAAAACGDYCAVGNYGFACRPWEVDKEDPFYPFVVRVNRHPLIEHPLDIVRPVNKPYVYYETNDYRPNPFIVEYPMRIATSLVYQDGDGACWFNWDDRGYLPPLHSDEDYITSRLPMPDKNYPNAGLILANDEVMLAAIKAAGAIFRLSNLPPAQNPTTYRIGKDILFNLSGCNFGGLEKFSEIEGWLRNHAWRSGIRVQYDPAHPSILPTGAEGWQNKFVKTGPYMTFDWSSGRGFLRIDAPTVKAYVGFAGPAVKFGNTQITGLNREFLLIAFVAEDGLPLTKSRSILAVLTSRNTNTGFKLDPSLMKKKWSEGLAEAVVNPGTEPVITDRVSAAITAPWLKGLTFQKFNFARKCFQTGKTAGTFAVTADEPLFYARLVRN